VSLRVVPPPSPLTPAQRALFDSEPDLAADAADAAYRELGGACFRHLSRAEMLSIATIAAMEATVTFDPALVGAKYRPWAFFRAMGAVLNAAKREGMQYGKTNALIRAHMMTHFGRATAEVESDDTDESLTDKLHDFSNPVLGLALAAVAAGTPAGDVDEVAEVEVAAMAGEALRVVLPPVGSAERRMLEMYFVERKSLAQVATAMGVDERRHKTFARRFDQVLASLRAGLLARGICEMPPWQEDMSGRALRGEE
jgi:DNA-directed RNA polymerase specialized sigma subunit